MGKTSDATTDPWSRLLETGFFRGILGFARGDARRIDPAHLPGAMPTVARFLA